MVQWLGSGALTAVARVRFPVWETVVILSLLLRSAFSFMFSDPFKSLNDCKSSFQCLLCVSFYQIAD